MSNSNLISFTDIGHGKYNTRNSPITKITIHHLAAVGDLSRITTVIRNNDVSWNYGIARNGMIGMFVPEDYRSWSSNSIQNDSQSVNIVVCNSTLGPDWKVSEAAIGSLKKLCYDICVRNDIRKLTFTGHLSTSNLTLHRWFDQEVSCPGPHLLSKISNVVNDVNSWLDSYYNSTATQEDLFKIRVQVAITPSGQYLNAEEINVIETTRYSNVVNNIEGTEQYVFSNTTVAYTESGQSFEITPDMLDYTIEWKEVDKDTILDFPIIDYELKVNRRALHPYIVTLSENTNSIDYSVLENIGVIGVMIYGGSLFDSNHNTRPYQSAKLRNQVEQANNANIPFGLYVKVRANTVEEARVELHNLFQVVSKFPPELGVWLQLEMNATTRVCDSILSCYYQAIDKWGLKSKCGLYVTRSQLNKITWSKFKQYFLLNLIDHVPNISKMNEVLTESFFNI